jgi:large subunit ribosomal protein L3
MTQESSSTVSVETLSLNSVIMKKVGMTRIFDEAGNHVPVTVLELTKSKVLQLKSVESDGYHAVKFAYDEKKEKNLTSATKGNLKKAGVEEMFSKMAETRLSGEETDQITPGKAIDFNSFTAGQIVNVSGVTKGKGFAGVVKKYGFAGGPKSHGSKFHRTTGSIGNRATPGKVWKGKKMPGHMGCEKQTVKNLTVVETNLEKGYMLIKGSVPGSKNSFVRVTKA